MRKAALLLLITFIVGCANEAPAPIETKETQDTLVSQSIKEEPKIDLKKVLTEQDSIRVVFNHIIDSIHRSKSNSIRVKDFLTSDLPDINEGKRQVLNNTLSTYIHEGFMVLLESFQPTSTVDSLKFYPETTTIRSFHQNFTNGLAYSQHELESGMDFMYYFPSDNQAAVKNFISRVYGDNDHTWVKEDQFSPKDGEAGCYISLTQKDNQIIASGYCGC